MSLLKRVSTWFSSLFKKKKKPSKNIIIDPKDKRSDQERALELYYGAPFMENDKRKEIKKAQNVFLSLISTEETKMFNTERGMCNGLGINLLSSTEDTIAPSYWEWDKITKHWGVQGASGVGKTVLMLTHAKQIIEKGWNLIITDPKSGHGQEIINAVASFMKESGRQEDFINMSPEQQS